ncbi:leucine-rich repeat protein, partial [Ruminococcus sp.]|uniref:leucine-rich repeat domain-containing protein n=1 Tax=Ruminococcus sp. TaxID=41978 RepID=UPI003863070B
KVNFGEIKIELGEGSTAIVLNADNETVTRDIMPDDTLRVSMLVGKAADTEDFYWKAKATVTIADTTTTLDSGWSTETYNTKEDTSAVTIDFKLDGDTYGNEYENKTVTIGYEIRAIQMANLTEPQADYSIENNSEQVFFSGEDLVMDSSEVASEGLKFSTATLMYISAVSSASIAEVGNVGVEESSTGLVYVVDEEDDTTATECFLVGLGTCTDTEIVVPKYDELGRKVVGVVGSAVNYANILGVKIEGNVDTTIKSITLPNSIKYIDSGAFACMSASINLDELTNLEYIGYGAFAMSTISELVIPSSVTAIGENAFAYSPYLSKVTMSSGITEIGKAAFYNCTNLTSINLPSTVKTVGEGAFQNCSNLQTVRLGGITEIPYGLFYDCKALSSVTLPTNLKTIGTWAFGNCSNLTEVTIPASVISIEYSAFNGCTSLSSVTLSRGLETIGDYAFWYCNMSSIEIPDTVTTMGTYAFAYCSALKDVKLSSGLTVLNEWSFAYCTNLQTIIFTKSIKTVNTSAFNESSLNIIYYTGNSSEWASTTINTYNDALINARVYYYSETYLDTGWRYVNNVPTRWSNASEGLEFAVLTTYSSVSEVSAKSDIVGTAECIGLGSCSDTDIIIPSVCFIDGKLYSVTQIGKQAFHPFTGGNRITSIQISKSVINIGEKAFQGCSELSTVMFEDEAKLTSIGEYAFSGCSKLTNIELPNELENIEAYALHNCSSLSNIKIPSSVINMGEAAFKICEKLEEVIFGENSHLGSIEKDTFYNCYLLKNIEIPGSVISIGENAFWHCWGLEELTFTKDSQLTTIAQNAFKSCRKIKTIVFLTNANLSIYSEAFSGCEALENIVFPSTLQTISSAAFYACSKLTSVYYAGTESSWSKLNINSYNNSPLISATTYYYSETDTGADNIWHYVEGMPTVWQ